MPSNQLVLQRLDTMAVAIAAADQPAPQHTHTHTVETVSVEKTSHTLQREVVERETVIERTVRSKIALLRSSATSGRKIIMSS